MKINSKKILKWLISFGKIKGSILFFLFTSGTIVLFYLVYCLIIKTFSDKSYSYIFHDNNSSLLIYILITLLSSTRFYSDAEKKINELEELKKEGLTGEDIKRIQFIKKWEETRKTGIIRYCLYDGGTISGMILFFPISFIMFSISGYSLRSFPELKNMMFFILECVGIGYLLGAGIYRVRWTFNERKFSSLTDPLR